MVEQFQVGDRVRLVERPVSDETPLGSEGTIARFSATWYVYWDSGAPGNMMGYMEKRLELIPPSSPFDQSVRDYIRSELL